MPNCPFCGKPERDKAALKIHLTIECEEYQRVEEEPMNATEQHCRALSAGLDMVYAAMESRERRDQDDPHSSIRIKVGVAAIIATGEGSDSRQFDHSRDSETMVVAPHAP